MMPSHVAGAMSGEYFRLTMTPADRLASCKRYLPWVVATVMFMETLDATIVNTAIPAMAASLQVQPLSLKAVVASYILSLAVFIPISGWMADRTARAPCSSRRSACSRRLRSCAGCR